MFDGIKGVQQIALRAGQSITVSTTRHGTASAALLNGLVSFYLCKEKERRFLA